MATGDKLVNLDDLKTAYDALNTAKLPVDFSGLTAGTSVTGTDLIAVDTGSTTKKVQMSVIAPTPFVIGITTGQWSGSGSDRYFTVQASNVTADSILIPSYDSTSQSRLNGPVWCVPAAGSFSIHTTAIPSNTVTIIVQFVGTLGTADYQVLSDVYSKSQTDALIAQSTAVAELAFTTSPSGVVSTVGGKMYQIGKIVILDLEIAMTGSITSDWINVATLPRFPRDYVIINTPPDQASSGAPLRARIRPDNGAVQLFYGGNGNYHVHAVYPTT
jgi:hypothetical protein